MKALVIAPQPFFSPRGTPFSVYYRTLITTQMGVEVDLLTYGEGQDVDIPNVRIIRVPRFAFLGNVKMGPSALKLFLDFFMIIWAIGLLIRNRYQFVHAHEEAVFFCRFLKPIFGFKLIYDMHSSLPEQLTNFNFSKSKLLFGAFRWLENTSLRAAEVVITICPALADYVEKEIDNFDKHLLIENSIFDQVKLKHTATHSTDKTDIPTYDADQVRAELPQDKRFLVYAGTLEHYQGIDLVVNGFAEVLAKHADAYLLIIGGTVEQADSLRKLAEKKGVSESCLFTSRVPQPLATIYINMASVLLSPRSEGTNTPLKLYQQLASGIPLIASNIYSHTQVLDDSVAFLVDPTPEGLAKGMLSALDSEQLCKQKSTNAVALYEEKYSRPVYEAKMKKVLDMVR